MTTQKKRRTRRYRVRDRVTYERIWVVEATSAEAAIALVSEGGAGAPDSEEQIGEETEPYTAEEAE